MESSSISCFFMTTPPPPSPQKKNQIFQWTSEILKFFILDPILSFKSNWILSENLQFQLLVMTEKNIFVYKLFVVDFLCKNCTPPPPHEKVHCQVLSSPPFFGNLVGGSTPPSRKGRSGAHYALCFTDYIHIRTSFITSTFSLWYLRNLILIACHEICIQNVKRVS